MFAEESELRRFNVITFYRDDFRLMSDGSSGFDMLLTALGYDYKKTKKVDCVQLHNPKEGGWCLWDVNDRPIERG